MQLTANFTLEELTKSQHALRNNIDNAPGDDAVGCLRQVAQSILHPVREQFGVPFTPSSAFRCSELNQAIGGSQRSKQILGQAVDFEVPGVSNFDLAVWIRDNLEFEQLILECYTLGEPNSGWVHVSFVEGENRNEVLTYGDGDYQQGLIV